MPDWENIRHLAALAAGGSLSAAARALGVDHATVARRVAALEQELSLKLIDRRGRRIALTTEGERIAGLAGAMDAAARGMERIAAGASGELSGEVTISAPPALAAAMLTAPLAELGREHPALTIRLIGETRTISLDRREADLAVRLTRPVVGDLTVTRLGAMPFRFYASPDYLARTPAEAWRFVGRDDRSAQQSHIETVAAGRPIGFVGSTSEIHRAAALAGAGLALVPDFLIDDTTGLVAVETGAPPFALDIWLVVHTDLKTAARVRVVMDRLRAAFAVSSPASARTCP